MNREEAKKALQKMFESSDFSKREFVDLVTSAIGYVKDSWDVSYGPGCCAFCGSLTCDGRCFK